MAVTYYKDTPWPYLLLLTDGSLSEFHGTEAQEGDGIKRNI